MADAEKEDSLLKPRAINVSTMKQQALCALIQKIRDKALSAMNCPHSSDLGLKNLLY